MVNSLYNIILDPILIFVLGPIPELGIKGATLAAGIGQTITLFIYIAFYVLKPIQVHIEFRHLTIQKEMILKLYSVGIPAALNSALPSLLVSSLNAILAVFSQTYVLVLGVYYKLQTFLYLPSNGIVQGIRPLIGYNYGAGEYKRVKKIYTTALSLITIIMVFGTILCLLIPTQLMSLFTSNIETIQAGTTALRIISTGFIVSSVSVTSCGALEGLGMGMPSLVISLFRYLILIIPAAFILSRFMGTIGVWCAFGISELITAVIAYFIYHNRTRFSDRPPHTSLFG